VQRIIRTKLKGPLKMELDKVGTVYGTIEEDSTMQVEKRGEEKSEPD
jgi:hypothetical protein